MGMAFIDGAIKPWRNGKAHPVAYLTHRINRGKTVGRAATRS